ncbi:MAG: CHAP domain-containing protein, partial [bacterium]
MNLNQKLIALLCGVLLCFALVYEWPTSAKTAQGPFNLAAWDSGQANWDSDFRTTIQGYNIYRSVKGSDSWEKSDIGQQQSYRNDKLQLAFQYPVDWKLEEWDATQDIPWPDAVKYKVRLKGSDGEDVTINVFQKPEGLKDWLREKQSRDIDNGWLNFDSSKAIVSGQEAYMWRTPRTQDYSGISVAIQGNEYLYYIGFPAPGPGLGKIEAVIVSLVVGLGSGSTELASSVQDLLSNSPDVPQVQICCGETDPSTNTYPCCSAGTGNCTWKSEERRSGSNNFVFGGAGTGRDAYRWMSLARQYTSNAQGGNIPVVGAVLVAIASYGGVGHVGTVSSINSDGSVMLVEQNCDTTCTRTHTYDITWLRTYLAGYIYNGSSPPIPTPKNVGTGETIVDDFNFSNTYNFLASGPGATVSWNSNERAWGTSSTGAYNNWMHYTTTRTGLSENAGQWSVNVLNAGTYEIQAYVPNNNTATANSARYKVNGVYSTAVNQAANNGVWVKLSNPSRTDGNWSLGTGVQSVELADTDGGSSGLFLGFDAIKFISVAGCSINVGQGTTDSELLAFQNAYVGQGALGCPTAAVRFDGFTSFAGTVGHFQTFTNGAIEYLSNGSRAGQAYAVLNPLYNKWASLGFNSSNPVGYPVDVLSSQSTSCFGTNLKYQVFEGGALEYHLSGARAGSVYEVHGAIYAKWLQKGFAGCPLGLPLSDERDAQPSGWSGRTGRVSDFEGGHIHWRAGTPQAFETHGAIDHVFMTMGGTASWLGFPISDEYVASGYPRGDFEGGYITTTDGVNYRAFAYVTTRVELPLTSCGQESSLRSIESSTLSSIQFINNTAGLIRIYWLNYSGQRVLYSTLSQGQSYVQGTYLTMPWVVTDSIGTCLGIYLTIPEPGRATIIGTSPPANDNFANAELIAQSSGLLLGTNVGASKELGEPNHAGNAGGASVWYRWQAPISGTATFATTDGSSFDTLLAVYTGSGPSNLTLIAANDDFRNTLQSAVSFSAQAGVVYNIAVDGFGGATGSILLSWSLNSPISSSRLAVQVGSDGRFNMGGLPDTNGGAGPDSWDLMFRWPYEPWSSFSTLRVDGIDSIYGLSGTQIEAPTNINATTNRSKWQIGDIEVTQTIEIVLNPQTGQNDVAKISYTLRNTGPVSHNAGLRVMIDTEINYNDGAPFRIPGVGIINTETEFAGSSVPDTLQVFYDVTDNAHVAGSTLKSGGATAPDRLLLAHWPDISNTAYDYTITPGLNFADDSAYALYWNPTALAPASSRTYTTFYGLAELQVNLLPPLALGVTGPATLSIISGQYSPNPFDVVATVLNNGTATATNVRLTLNLPTGLSLAAGSATQALGDLEVGKERQVSWSVLASPQSTQTTLTYSVDATASNAESKTIQRQITVPALCIAPSVTTQPSNQSITSGQTATLNVVASGTSPLTYQWYQGSSGNTSSPIAGATSASYTTPALTITTSYWIRLSNACGQANSNTATIAVTMPMQRPLIFIPGILGSQLDNFPPLSYNANPLWPSLGHFLKTGEFLLFDPYLLDRRSEIAGVNIKATDAIRRTPLLLGNKDIYESFLFTLTNQGYTPYVLNGDPNRLTSTGCDYEAQKNNNPYLFVFPYDWRLSNTENAARLKDYVGCVQRFYPDPNQKIDIVTHSMGGLLARSYLLQYPSDHHVGKLITIAAPWLGAPKATRVLVAGDFWDSKLDLLTSASFKSLSEFFPSVHELTPSRPYFESVGAPPPYILNGRALSYAQMTSLLDGRFTASRPGSTNRTFHQLAQD